MRAEALVFLHVLAAATLIGAVLAVAVLSPAGSATARLAFRASLLTLAAALATVAIGEATRSRESPVGLWLDVGSMLGYIGLLFPSIGLAILAGRARERENLRPWVTGIALAMLAVAIAATFVMAAKPS